MEYAVWNAARQARVLECAARVAVSSGELLRAVYPRVLARTLSLTRNLPAAEDAVQEAVRRALEHWPTEGTPASPEAWLVTVASNAHKDRLRKAKWEAPHSDALETLSAMSPWVQSAVAEPNVVRGFKDELLGLVFACCHPCLEPGESAALCLATVIGLSTKEVAAAFLTEPRSMEQRLNRARQRLRSEGDAEGRSPEQSRDRLGAVLKVIHLLFNEGYWSTKDGEPIRADLCRLGLGLSRSLTALYPDEAEAWSLLGLITLHEARRAARLASDGSAVALPDQDRSRWDHDAVARGEQCLERAAALNDGGAFFYEACIALEHCRAATAQETNWTAIAEGYERLEALRPTRAVRVNRAFAVAKAHGAERGLALLDEREPASRAMGRQGRLGPVDESEPASVATERDEQARRANRDAGAALVRGVLLAELGRIAEAVACLEEARDRARNTEERRQITERLAALSQRR